jgi:hypothetical protein
MNLSPFCFDPILHGFESVLVGIQLESTLALSDPHVDFAPIEPLPPNKPPPSIRLAEASRADSRLGGGAPTCTTTTRANLGARAMPDTAPAAVED